MPRLLQSALFWLTLLLRGVGMDAQQPTFHDALLDHLAGRWVLQGTIAKKPTTHDVEAEWVMAHQYLRIHEVSRELNPDGTPQYEATVYVGWDEPAARYTCAWLDVYGGSFMSIGNAKRSGDTIPFIFQDREPGEGFRTTFVYHSAADTWDWIMDNESKGVLRPFARLTLARPK